MIIIGNQKEIRAIKRQIDDVISKVKVLSAGTGAEEPKTVGTDNNKLFSMDEYRTLGKERLMSLELFFSATRLTPEHAKLMMEKMDQETRVTIMKRTMESLMKISRNR